MAFSSVVWAIPSMLILAAVIAFTLNHHVKTTKISNGFAITSFILSLCVIAERYLTNEQDYAYYFDWFVLDYFYYRMGYELNHTSAFFLVIVTGLTVILQLVNILNRHIASSSAYGYLNLIFGLLSGIIIADNILTYYIISFCMSVAVFIQLAYVNEQVQPHTLRKSSKSFIIGHLLFLCALMLIFYHQSNHAVEFTVINSSLNMQPDLLKMDQEWIIGLLLVLSTVFISTLFVPFGRHFITKSSHHIISLYLLMAIRIVVPTYMLIRFESLIRIDVYTEIVVLILGVWLLIHTCRQMFKLCDAADILLHLSNGMLGMLYVLYGLQANLMLSAIVLVFVMVIIISLFFTIIRNNQVVRAVLKIMVALMLLLPFIISMSTGSLDDVESSQYYNIVSVATWLSLMMYSFIVCIGMLKFQQLKLRQENDSQTIHVIIFIFIFIVAICVAVSAGMSWWNVYTVSIQPKVFVDSRSEVWRLAGLNWVLVAVGFTLAFAVYRSQVKRTTRYLHHKHSTDIHYEEVHVVKQRFNIISPIKAIVVMIVERCERYWDMLWEYTVPFLFKRLDIYITTKQPSVVVRVCLLWLFAIILSILLIMIRG